MTAKSRWLNARVISISNEASENALKVGTVVDIIPISKANTPTPLVLFDDRLSDEPMICMSTILEYDLELYITLKKLSPKERWIVVRAIVNRFNPREEQLL